MTLKLIIALDFDNTQDALSLVDKLDPSDCAVKVGSEMFTLFGANFVKSLISRGFKVFLDLKFHDIPNTVARACKASAELGVWMLTVHASGGLAMMQAGCNALQSYGSSRPLLMAVTVLTSMGAQELLSIGVQPSLESQVYSLALLAKESGLDGVICSAFEVSEIKTRCGADFLAVTPGIRMPDAALDDQSRVSTPRTAFRAGSNYLVVGRPITAALYPEKVVLDILSMTV